MPSTASRDLTVQPGEYAVCRLEPSTPLAAWMTAGPHSFIARTPEELSVIVTGSLVPPGVRSEGPYSLIRVDGTLDFALTGVIAALTRPLAEAEISVLAVATFDTDYLLVRKEALQGAAAALAKAGHRVRGLAD